MCHKLLCNKVVKRTSFFIGRINARQSVIPHLLHTENAYYDNNQF